MDSYFQINKKRDTVIRDQPGSDSEWSDIASDDDEDLISVDSDAIQQRREIALQAALMQDVTSKLLIYSNTHTFIHTHLKHMYYIYIEV